MRQLIIFLFVMLSWSLQGHDVRMAHYFFYVESAQVWCDAKIDKEDLMAVLGAAPSQTEMYDYLSRHLSIQFDGENINTSLTQLTLTDEWIEVRLSLKTVNTAPNDVIIFNDILSHEIHQHDNLMRFIFHGRKRFFRLNKERQQVSFTYKNNDNEDS